MVLPALVFSVLAAGVSLGVAAAWTLRPPDPGGGGGAAAFTAAESAYDLAAAALGAVDGRARAVRVLVTTDLAARLPPLAGEIGEDRRYLEHGLRRAIVVAAGFGGEVVLAARPAGPRVRYSVGVLREGRRHEVLDVYFPVAVAAARGARDGIPPAGV